MNVDNSGDSALFAVPSKVRSRTADVIKNLAEQIQEPTTSLRGLSERFGDRTFGMLLIIVAILSVVPLVSFFAGILVGLLGMQMLLGMARAWLPQRVLDYPLNGDKVKRALMAFEPRVRSLEKYIKPRWQFTEAPIVDRLNGLIVACLGAMISVPLPLTNIGPALVIILMGIGLMERDGVVQIMSLLLALVCMALLYFFVFSLLLSS